MINSIVMGDCKEVMATMPDESVHCCVTSPPYWGLRDYGTAKWDGGDANCDHSDDVALAERLRQKKSMIACGERIDGSTRTRIHDETIGKTIQYKDTCQKCGAKRIDAQLGLEKTPEEYVSNMVEVFREVKRVLRADGTLWLNLGSSYAGSNQGRMADGTQVGGEKQMTNKGSVTIYSGGISPNQSRSCAPAYDTDGKEQLNLTENDCACPDPCGESQGGFQSLRNHDSHNDQLNQQFSLHSEKKAHDIEHQDSKEASLGSFPFSSPASNCFSSSAGYHQNVSTQNHGGNFLLDGYSSSYDVQEFADKMAYTCGTTQNLRPSVDHNPDMESSFLAFQLPPNGLINDSITTMFHNVKFKPKDLVPIPWMVAMALQADGWYLRQDIIWHKPNPMPESVTDRPTKSHEYIFLLSKSQKYYYDAEAIKETAAYTGQNRGKSRNISPKGMSEMDNKQYSTRNKRSVWTITTKPFKKAHFATFPTKLIEPCILAGCPAKCCHECGSPWERVVERTTSTPGQKKGYLRDCTGRNDGDRAGSFTDMQSKTIGFTPTCKCNAGTTPGIVLDPFMGAGTVGLVAVENNRNYIGCELNPEYIKIAEQRITQAQPSLF